MDNTNLYEFSFVDRKESSKKLNYLLNNTSKLPLIVGKHGVGKSYFIDNFFKKQSKEKYVLIAFDAEINEHNGIKELLSALEKNSKTSFLNFFNINFQTVFRIIGNHTVEENFKDLSLLSDILNKTITVRTKDGKEKSIAEILLQYLLHIYSKEKVIIVFDNFHLCDKTSLEKLVPLIKKSLEENLRFRFVISLTLEAEQTVKHILEESIPREEVEILEFDNFLFFYEILFDILNICDKDKELVSRIYTHCNGNPQQLLNFMHKLDASKALIYSDKHNRAEIDHNQAKNLLCEDSTYISLSNFSIQQTFIIYIIIEFGILVPLDLLMEIVKFVMSRTAFKFQYDENVFSTDIVELYNKGIIIFNDRDNIQYIKMEHDLKINYYKKEIEKAPFFKSINIYLYEYITQNTNNVLLADNIDFLLTFHSYKGNVTNWKSINIAYGKKMYDKKDYNKAAEVFLRLTNTLDSLSAAEKIMLIDSFYNCGRYEEAKNIIAKLKAEELEKSDMYSYLFLKAKVNKFFLEQEEAEKNVDQLLQLENLTDEEYLNVLSLEERVFANSSNNRQRAFESYEKIKNTFKGNVNLEIIYGSCLKTSIEFYRGDKAQEDLSVSIKIAENYKNTYELGAIYTNQGFDFFWQGKIEKALNIFQKAYDILINVAEYEVSYPLNNMANCYIMKGDYDNAIHYLKAALYWNKSDYVRITLKILLTYCFAMSDKDFDVNSDENFKYILENMNSSAFSDISIKIKVNYLVGCIYEAINQPICARVYKEKAFEYANSHNPKYLPYVWMLDYNNEIESDIRKRIPRDKFCSFYQNSFDPWLVTLSHD